MTTVNRVLIADDDEVSRRILQAIITRRGFVAELVDNGVEALARLSSPDAPRLALLDWEMPLLSGVDVCRALKAKRELPYVFTILVTGAAGSEVEGLQAGADDFINKPARPAELCARLQTGVRMITLQIELEQKVAALESAAARIRYLEGLVPICMHCHRIRDEADHWQKLESFLHDRTGAVFSHGLCEPCFEEHYRG